MHPRRRSLGYAIPGAGTQRRFFVLLAGKRIGSTDLEVADAGLGFASGRFYPDAGYEAIQAKDAPLLALSTAAGEIVRTEFVTIDDSGIAAEPEISVAFTNPRQFFRLADVRPR